MTDELAGQNWDLPSGVPTGGLPINLSQLRDEMATAGLSVDGLGMADDLDVIFTYDAGGLPADFDPADVPAVQTAIANHVAMRDKTDAEYQAEYATANTQRKATINAIVTGLQPREQVPM